LWQAAANPQAAWSTGCACAEEILQAHHVCADFTEAFSHENMNVDMLRPFPDGIYPGICADPDPSLPTLLNSTPTIHREPIDDDGDEENEDEVDGEIDIGMDNILHQENPKNS
jgi:hypothetical protein